MPAYAVRPRHLLAVLVTLTSALALGACGPGAAAAGTTATQAQGRAQGQGSTGAGRFGGRGFPGVVGEVAEVTGHTAQVQNVTSQTAVTWTGSTTFTSSAATTAAHLHVGDCVTARPARPADARGSTASAPLAPPTTVPPSGTAGSNTTVAAATVEVFPATGGTCTAVGLGGSGGFGNGAGANRPSTAPTRAATTGGPNAAPGGADGDGFRGGPRGTTGRVTTVGTGSFTVSPTTLRSPNGPSGATLAPVTVTYASSTTFTRVTKATAKSVTVGVCVTAIGTADGTGAVTARTIAVSRPVDGTCTSAFGTGGGFRRPGAAATGTTSG